MQQQAQSTRTEMRPVKYHYADTFWCTYIISVVSANVAELGELILTLYFVHYTFTNISLAQPPIRWT